MTDRERLNAEIDAGPYQTLLILADLCEEEGDPWTAQGYRWLGEERKWPKRDLGGEWLWQFGVNDAIDTIRQAHVNAYDRALGKVRKYSDEWIAKMGDRYEYYKNFKQSRLEQSFSSASLALNVAAVAVGCWLKEHAPKGRKRKKEPARIE